MDALQIEGPGRLKGDVEVSKAKNAYLPILAALLLTEEEVHLKSVPLLRDIQTMHSLLSQLGVSISSQGEGFVYNASHLTSYKANYKFVKTMRASICILGSLLGRCGRAHVSLPGGCAIGIRPIDLHLENLEKLGAQIDLQDGYIRAKAPKGLKGAHIRFRFPSVGATENLILAAVYARGITTLENCACEPEVSDLAHFLNHLGAKIQGIGSSTLVIEGVSGLRGGEYKAIGDRIEAATYIIAGLITGSEILVKGFNPADLKGVIEKLKKMNARLEVQTNAIRVRPSELGPAVVETAPYPGFPTDIQAQMVALATQIKGVSWIKENIFENRFMHVPELMRLGAHITLKHRLAVITGSTPLKAAPLMCTDLRASAALVLGALCAQGQTQISRIYHLDRGYDQLDKKLKKLGVKIHRIKEAYS